MNNKSIFPFVGGLVALALLGFGLLATVAFGAAGAAQNGGDGLCQAPQPDLTHLAQTGTSGQSPATATPEEENPCFSSSRFGAQVVAWAKKMADALTRGALVRDAAHTARVRSLYLLHGGLSRASHSVWAGLVPRARRLQRLGQWELPMRFVCPGRL